MIAQKGGQSLRDVSRRIERRALCFGKEGKHGWPAFRFMRDGVQATERTPDFIAFPAPQILSGRWRFEAARFRPTGLASSFGFPGLSLAVVLQGRQTWSQFVIKCT